MKKKIIIGILTLALLLGLVAGCSAPAAMKQFAAGADMAYTTAAAEPAAPAAPAAPMPESAMMDSGGWENGTEEALNSSSTGGYKIIRTANLSLETRNFDTDLAYIKEKVNVMGGYISSSHVSGRKPENYGDRGRYANMTVRIPQERMESFLADARGVATVVSESTGGEDITASYFDTESRLAVYTAQRERILKLLETATRMEDVIVLEQEHARLTYEIESLTTQVRRWDDLVDMATVHIDLNEIAPASASASDDSFGTRVSEGIARTFASMSVFFENLLVFLIVASPVLILIAVIALIIVFLIRRGRKDRGRKPSRKERRAARKAEKKAAKQAGKNGVKPDIYEDPAPKPDEEK